MAFADALFAVDVGDATAGCQDTRIGPKTHASALIGIGGALLHFIALHPFGHQTDDRIRRVAELRRTRLLDARDVARGFDHGHLHPEANAEIRHIAFARKTRGFYFT